MVADGPLKLTLSMTSGIQCPLDQILDALQLLRFGFKILDEETSDGLAFPLRVGDALQSGQKLLGPIEDPEIQMQLRGKRLLHLIALPRPQYAIVDEDTGQLIADGPMGKRRGDR